MLYENETRDIILERLLGAVTSNVDKRLGSIIFDSLAPDSIEFELFYQRLEHYINQAFADTAEREYLIRRAGERGIAPYPATYAIVTGVFTPSSLNIPIGARFYCGEYVYAVTEKLADGRYYLQSETIGAEVNGNIGRLIPVETINGLKTAELVEVSILGENEEDTEVFRQRYYESLSADQYGGNVAEYKAKIRSMQGVGGVKVYPAWNGGGTVRCVIVNSALGVPTETLVQEVQEAIDPIVINGEDTQGQGLGIAPIGHFVTIMGANAYPINIRTQISFKSGYSFATMQDEITSTLRVYYRELNTEWQNNDSVIVRIAEINARLLNVNGVLDIRDTMLNGKYENVNVDADSIPILGTFELM